MTTGALNFRVKFPNLIVGITSLIIFGKSIFVGSNISQSGL
jgi:hypothetical protein